MEYDNALQLTGCWKDPMSTCEAAHEEYSPSSDEDEEDFHFGNEEEIEYSDMGG